jgi:hypothetical protein
LLGEMKTNLSHTNYASGLAKKMADKPKTPPAIAPFAANLKYDPWSPPTRFHEPDPKIISNPKNERVMEPLLTQQVWRRRTLPEFLQDAKTATAGDEFRVKDASGQIKTGEVKPPKSPSIFKPFEPKAVDYDPWSKPELKIVKVFPVNPKLERVQEPMLTSQVWRRRTVPDELHTPRTKCAGDEFRLKHPDGKPILGVVQPPKTPASPTPFVAKSVDPWHTPERKLHPAFDNKRIQEPLLTQQVYRRRTLPPQLYTPRTAQAGFEFRTKNASGSFQNEVPKTPASPTPFQPKAKDYDPYSAPQHPVHPNFSNIKPVEEMMLSKQVWLRRTLPAEALAHIADKMENKVVNQLEIKAVVKDGEKMSKGITPNRTARAHFATFVSRMTQANPRAHEQFRAYLDKDGSGLVSVKELHAAMESFGVNINFHVGPYDAPTSCDF